MFIIISALHVLGSFSTHHQELIKLCVALGIVMLPCCLPLVWMGWNNPSTPSLSEICTCGNFFDKEKSKNNVLDSTAAA
jgi:hypothetical protein